MKHLILLTSIATALIVICFCGQAQAQTMDELMQQMAEDAVNNKSKAGNSYNNYANDLTGQQSNQPLTPEQAQQHTTNNLLRALSEASKKPEGETREQRQDRLINLTNEIRNENAAISRRQNEYNQEQTRRLLGAGNSNAITGINNSNDYAAKRRQRLEAGENRSAGTQNSNAKPAGFGDGYAGGFKHIEQDEKPSGLSVNASRASGASTTSTRRGRRTATRAADVEDVKDTPTKSPDPTGCMCKGGDELLYGVQCLGDDIYWAAIDKPFYPWTQNCSIHATTYH